MAPGSAKFLDRSSKLLSSLTSNFSKQKGKNTYTMPATDQSIELPPPITQRTAILCSIVFTILYIAPFYLSPTLRSTPLSSRDAPSVIQARVRAVILTCAACSAIAAFVILDYGHATSTELLRLTGLWPMSLIDCSNTILLLSILFIGPLYENLIVDGEWRDLTFSSMKERSWTSWTGYRNLVVAPVTEELVFRSLTVPLFLLARADPVRIVTIIPLIFGLAHLHHLAEFLSAHTLPGKRFASRSVIVKGLLRSMFQFLYTSLFGSFATFLFLRTGSLWTVILAHSFCNAMGFPRVWGRVGHADASSHHLTPDVAQGKRDEDADGITKVGNAALLPDDDYSVPPGQGSTALHTVCYYVLLLGGAFGFSKLLWPLTASEYALAQFL